MNKPLTLAVIGAGMRGTFAYANYAREHPDELRVSAVAEPNQYRRNIFAKRYKVSEDAQFSSWQELLDKHRADGLLIATQDSEHYEPILRAMKENWNILCEKPVTNSPEEALELLPKITGYDKVFYICHVLRYTPFFNKIKQLLNEGHIGKIITIQHNENVGYFHYAHSFVRGHWRRSDIASPMILAKSCHDLDILNWLLDEDCKKLSSFGSLSHFRTENMPSGAPKHCLEGCPVEQTCPYSARKYFEKEEKFSAFTETVLHHAGTDNLTEALQKGPYGRCVYQCDNDVVDHQVLNLEYENNAAVAFTMSAFTQETSRTIKIMGSMGEIRGHMEKHKIELQNFCNGKNTIITPEEPIGGYGYGGQGHDGGDWGIIREFIHQIRNPDLSAMRRNNRQGIMAHLMAFAAEQSRRSGQVMSKEDILTMPFLRQRDGAAQ